MFNPEQWYENFRVTGDIFTIILNEIEHNIAKQDTLMRKAVPTRKKLAMTLFYFASTAKFRTVANLFGVSRAFLCNCIKDVCCAIIKNLQRILIYIPKDDYLKSIFETYKEKWGFPMCAGVIDGTHIAIIAPKEDHTDYVNRKGYHSVVMQAFNWWTVNTFLGMLSLDGQGVYTVLASCQTQLFMTKETTITSFQI